MSRSSAANTCSELRLRGLIMASIPMVQSRDLFAARLAELARKLDDPTPLAIRVVRNELARLAQG